jgi:uncharacterized membrane protein YesL
MLKSIDKVNYVFTIILNLVYVNFLWAAFTLLGLVVFGIGPSTYALASICRQWVRGKSIPVFASYWKYYKESFREAVLVSWIFSAAGFVIIVDLLTVSNWYLKAALLFIGFIYILSLVFIFPVMAHYEWKGIFFKMKMSLLFGLSCLQYSLVLMAAAGVFYWAAASFFPGILTFLGASLFFYLSAWTANQVFTRMELANAEEVNDTNKYQIVKGNKDEEAHGI